MNIIIITTTINQHIGYYIHLNDHESIPGSQKPLQEIREVFLDININYRLTHIIKDVLHSYIIEVA